MKGTANPPRVNNIRTKVKSSKNNDKNQVVCLIKTLILSVVCVLWHFCNFFLLYGGERKLFFLSFLILSASYGLMVLDKWFVRLSFVVVSLVILQAGTLACWHFYTGSGVEKVTHWESFMYVGFHLFMPILSILAGVVIAVVYEAVAGPVAGIISGISSAKNENEYQQKPVTEAYAEADDDGTVIYTGSSARTAYVPANIDTASTLQFAAVKPLQPVRDEHAPGSAINNVIIDIEIADEVLPNIVPEAEQQTDDAAEESGGSTVA